MRRFTTGSRRQRIVAGPGTKPLHSSPLRQPLYVRSFNRVGAALGRSRPAGPRLDPDRLQGLARRYTGLDDFGDPGFARGLEVLLEALEEEGRLSSLGRCIAFFNLLNLLAVRLRMVDASGQRAEPGAIRRPLVITGLPRTGTTILHELIACDPAFRAPLTWEVMRPVPRPQPVQGADTRIPLVARLLGLLELIAPGFRTIHAIGARLPQECVYLLSSHFHSEQFAYMFNVPTYRRWLLAQDMSGAYAWHRNFLCHLQAGWPPARWVLKTPAHLASLDALLACYPDADVVWMHRRPLDALASFASLTSTLRSGFSDHVDRVAAGRHEEEHFAAVLERAMAQRAALPAERFVDVSFDAVCADPIAVVGAIYAHFDIAFTDDARMGMEQYLRQRPRDLYGVHRYSAGEFGLDAAGERAHYGDYLERYGRWC